MNRCFSKSMNRAQFSLHGLFRKYQNIVLINLAQGLYESLFIWLFLLLLIWFSDFFSIVMILMMLNLLPTSDTLFSLELHLLIPPGIHLHLYPHIQLLIHPIDLHPHPQPRLPHQPRNLPNTLTHKNQRLINLINREGNSRVLLVDQPGVWFDEGNGGLEVPATVLEYFFEGDAQGGLVGRVREAVVDVDVVVYYEQALAHGGLAEEKLVLYWHELVGQLGLLHSQELEVKPDKALLRHPHLLLLRHLNNVRLLNRHIHKINLHKFLYQRQIGDNLFGLLGFGQFPQAPRDNLLPRLCWHRSVIGQHFSVGLACWGAPEDLLDGVVVEGRLDDSL